MTRLAMPPAVRAVCRDEINSGRAAAHAGDVAAAWSHLERAHVLAQPFPVGHIGSHIAQLRLGWGTRDRTEVAGQVVRIVVAGPASVVGRIPVDNDGRARTPLRATAPVPADLVAILKGAS
ncbi:MAG: DUF3703 domain-containing protein [Acidimicrobiia bacterium]|nr:DUF3703 domain-containing protein [Acidimicrobiia bacterium]